jgi:dienelactone hydrolase
MELTAPESGECRLKEVLMKIPAQIKPAAWGAAGGAIAAMIIGFTWGGWVTGGTSEKNARVAAQTAVVQALVPHCVAKAEQQPEQLILLKKENFYSRHDFVVKAGWVSNVAEEYRRHVAESCASAIVEAADAAAAKK